MSEPTENRAADLPERPTVYQLAVHYQVGVSTIWRWHKDGKFVAPIRIGGTTRWRRADIEAWEASRQSA